MTKLNFLCIFAIAALSGCGGNDQHAENETAIDSSPPSIEPGDEPSRTHEALSRPPSPIDNVMPDANARRGRILFVKKACVICHQINEVGGTAAPSLDRPSTGELTDPINFAARMWRGAQAMTALQSLELGYVIELDGQDIADIAAFTASKDERSLLTQDSISKEMRDWFLNIPSWTTDDWEEYLEQGEQIPLNEDRQ